MTGALWLHCRLPLVDGLDVFISPADGESVFAHRESDAPEGLHLSLLPDESGRVDGSGGVLPLSAVALALDPARSAAWLEALEHVLALDNRIDAEAALADLAVHLDRRIRLWRVAAETMRAPRENALRRQDLFSYSGNSSVSLKRFKRQPDTCQISRLIVNYRDHIVIYIHAFTAK